MNNNNVARSVSTLWLVSVVALAALFPIFHAMDPFGPAGFLLGLMFAAATAGLAIVPTWLGFLRAGIRVDKSVCLVGAAVLTLILVRFGFPWGSTSDLGTMFVGVGVVGLLPALAGAAWLILERRRTP